MIVTFFPESKQDYYGYLGSPIPDGSKTELHILNYHKHHKSFQKHCLDLEEIIQHSETGL